MIDIHCHILPGLDDGATGMEISLEMARAAAESGVRMIIATPHYIPGVYENDSETVIQAVNVLNARIQAENISLTVLPGTEAYMDLNLPALVRDKQVLTLNNGGKYLLFEFPLAGIPNYTEQVIFQLLLDGITPIVAHPERNKEILKNPERLYSLLAKGVLAQVNAPSLRGVWGEKIKNLAGEFLQLGWVHFIGTDAHSSVGSRSRPLGNIIPYLKNIAGGEMARALVTGNPSKVVDKLPIAPGDYKNYQKSRKKFFLGLLNRLKRN